MLLQSAILITLVYQAASVAVWQQCGGKGYTGNSKCDSGLSCNFVNEFYSQCQPGGAPAAQTTTTKATSQASGTTTKPSNTGTSGGKLNGCNFGYGRAYDQPTTDYSKFDYITIWLGTIADNGNTDFNKYYQGTMLETCKKLNKLPAFYSYIIAFEARSKQGLKDCDVGSPSLCEQGANYIRNNRAHLVARYKHQAQNIASYLGKNGQVVFFMEPDFYQYYSDHKQAGGTLSGEFMRALFDDFAQAIKSELPNAIISWDISAWATEDQMRKWWGFFQTSPYIDYIQTSGGQARPDTTGIKPNELAWSFMSKLTGKKILADCGYGVFGVQDNNCKGWNVQSNLSNRLNDGVVALSQGSYGFDPVSRPKVC